MEMVINVYGYATPSYYTGWTAVGLSSYTYNLQLTWTYTNDAYTWYWHLTNSVGTSIAYNISTYYATPTGYTYSYYYKSSFCITTAIGKKRIACTS